jgi:hypothetical protein
MVLNHSLTVVRTELAKLTKNRPISEVMAASDEQVDIAAAKVGTKALEGAEWKFKKRQLHKQLCWWMLLCGVSAEYVGYDHMKEDDSGELKFFIDPNTSEPIFDEARVRELQEQIEAGELGPDALTEESFPLGDIEYKLYTAFQLLPDELAMDFDFIKDLITLDTVNIDEAIGLWDTKELRSISPDQLTLGAMTNRVLARAGAGIQPSQIQNVEDALEVRSWWLLPGLYPHNSYLKNGRMVRWVKDNIVLENMNFPFDDKRMPFAFYRHIPSDLSIWPHSIIEHIRHPNIEIDRRVSQLIENANYMANPMWRVATQHQIKGKIKNQPGGMVRYVHAPNVPPPEQIPGQPMPTQVENLVVALRDQILDISGQGETSRGRVPSGVRSGVAVAYLQEEDETKLAPTAQDFEAAIAMDGSLTLSRMGQYYTTNRVLRMYRRDGLFDVLRFKGADLKNNYDVIVVAGSALPKMKAARQQFVLELAQMGLVTDRKMLLDMLEVGYGEPDEIDKAARQADRENRAMMTGIGLQTAETTDPETGEQLPVPTAIPVMMWHNHQVHISRHTSVMMDAEFDEMALRQPEVLRLFSEHLAAHQQILQQQQMEQMQMLQAAKGAPDYEGAQQQSGNGQVDVQTGSELQPR